MRLPQIKLVLGTTYRDLHSEREYLLKRTIPQIRRVCEAQGILFSFREMKWAEEPEMIARQMNRFLEWIADEDTYYLGIHTELRPPATSFSTKSSISSETAHTLEALIGNKASWRQIEEVLVSETLSPERIILHPPATHKDGSTRIAPPAYIPEELGASIEAKLLSIIELKAVRERSIRERSGAGSLESYHKLYLRQRASGALQRASKADELIRALSTYQQVVLLGVAGSGKSTTLALTLDALSASGESVIPYVFDGADTSAQGVADHIHAAIGSEATTSSDGSSGLNAGDGSGSTGSALSVFALTLSRAGQRIIALDGIEFLDQDSRYLGWIPFPIPSNIKVIASTSDVKQAEALELRGWKVIEVSALSRENISALIDHLCWERDLWLTADQRELIAQHPLSFHPQFLITLIEELGQFGWFAKLNKNLDEYLDEMSIYQLFNSATADAAGDTNIPTSLVLSVRLQHYLESHSLVELYQKVLERLEFDFGVPQLTRVLGYLFVASRGLTMDDLVALTGLTSSSVQQMLSAMGSSIMSRKDRLLIGNDHFAKAIEKRYLASQSVPATVRASLIRYLRPRTSDAHVLELAAQFAATGARDDLRIMLKQHPTFSTIFRSIQLDGLARFWKAVNSEIGVDQEYLSCLDSYVTIAPVEARTAHLRSAAELLLFLGRPAAANILLNAAIDATEGHAHLDAERAQLLRSLGRTLYSLSRYKESETAYRASIDVFGSLGPLFETDGLASRKDLAQLLAEGARYPEADSLYADIIKDTKRIHGDESPELASVLSSIGLMLNGQGKYDAAINVAASAKKIFVRHWGKDYPELGWCYFILATAYRQKGDLEEASQWYALAIERFVQMHGEEHPIPLRSMYGRAVLLQKQGDYDGAIEQARKVVELRTKLLGSKHADTAAAKVLLGSLLKARVDAEGRTSPEDRPSGEVGSFSAERSPAYTEAMTLLSEALEVFDSGANKEHPEVARTLHELGDVYHELQMEDKARTALLRAVSIRTNVLGAEHPDTLASNALINSLGPQS